MSSVRLQTRADLKVGPYNTRCVACALMLALLAGVSPLLAAEQVGQVTFGGLPVPGATVIALQGETQVVTSTDLEGVYRLGDLPDGVWTIRVEMQGFAPVVREVAIGADEPPATWELALLTLAEIAAVPAQTDTTGAPGTAPAATAQPDAAAGSRASAAAAVNPSPGPAPNPGSNPGAGPDEGNPFANESADSALDAADGLLINGSVNNSAASPFAQPRAFGNSRPGRRSLYNGMLGSLLGNSAWDARPFSFSTQQAPKPSYRDVQFLGTFGGPVRIPRLFRNAANLFVGYQRSGDTNATTQSALVPTRVERGGDFSQSRDAFGRPVQIVDPRTGLPFPGNVIPPERLSPQAASLLGYYPLPSLDASGFNHQAPIVAETRQDSVQSRWNQALTNRNQISATVAYRRSRTTTRSLFAFDDQAGTSALDLQAAWFRRLSQFVSVRLRPQFTRLTNTATPHFAGRTNVSGEAGIRGNNQDPQNWGPPSLLFADGVAGLSTAQYASTETQTQALGAEGYWFRGRHNITLGGDVRRHAIDVQSQQDARGTFAFTGAATGSALADFLLGLPTTGSIAFGNADKYLRAWSYDAYVTDDWRVGPSLTLNLGIRWEFEAPITERFGRLVNLDVAPGFQAVAPVLATSPVGPLTGSRYPNALMRADWRGIQPRLAAAWRPIPGSSLVVRAGYGIYRNTGVYQPIATLLAQQPPLSTTFSVESTALAPLTLADGLLVARARAFNTFAVDPDFRAGYARNWQASVQRDLPFSLTVVGTYSGAKGSHLLQQLLPNTQPPGAVNPCPACPAGFAYLTSGGRSLRHAGQLQLRRRLRNGFTATVQYTLATSTDNASAFTGGGLGGAVIAQDWLDLEAEHGPSSFDRRHLVTAQVQYTTGAGITGGTLIDGWKGRLFKDWTFTGQLTTGSGLPLTPVLLTPVRGTGVVGTVRASTTGADPNAIPDGYFLNPAAYAPPAPGEWGNAGRNSVTGPAQFSLNGSVARTFRVGDRLNLDWRIDATNLLNRVTYGGVNMLVTSPQFGLPNRANTMRKLQSSLRVRF